MEATRPDRRKVTADELYRMPARDDDLRHELDDGELILVPPTGGVRGVVELNIGSRIRNFLEENPLGVAMCGDVGFKLGEYRVRAPDVAFLSQARLKETPIPEEGYYPGAPDLVIEILSPGDSAGEVQRKVGRFLDAGTVLVWVIDPERRVAMVYRGAGPVSLISEEGSLDGEGVLPGFACRLSDILPPAAG